MSESKGISRSRRKALSSWLPGVAEAATEALGASRLETLEILTDVEQVSDLFASLDDMRKGRIVSMSDAFGDL
ncbi:MAG: hypothetical protein K0Q50_1053 [Vampirovibrio sp.]|nr:hypothetical protein [Vampirovibrio sp.]